MADTGSQSLLLQAAERAKSGDFAEAVELSRQLLLRNGADVDAMVLLGRNLAMLDRNDEAIEVLEKAAKAKPDDIEVLNLLGHLFYHSSQHDEAKECFVRCLALNPNHVESMRQIANLTLGSDQAGALRLFKQAYALAPNHADLLFDQAWAITYSAGDTDTGATLFRRWFEFGGGNADRGSIALQALNYASNQNPETLTRLHREWAAKHADPLGQAAKFDNHDFRADRPLRIGLLSADFCRHPVGRFALTLCHHIDRSRFELFVYANKEEEDELKASFESLASWRNIFSQRDDAVVRQITRDRVDILLDLSGHTKGSRLAILARRAGPVQASVFAYPNTTGMAGIDHRISDPHSDPHGQTEPLWVEQLERLPHTPWVYLPPLEINVLPGAPPSTTGEPFTLGCLNNPVKTSRACIQLWAQVLKRLPEARLILLQLNDSHGQRLRDWFAEGGAAQRQIDIRPKGGVTYFLKLHNEIDLMLDPFPYNGGVTTGDAFWMGVPLLCLEGDAYVSRQGVMQNKCLGLEAFIARDQREFIEKAVQISNEPNMLIQLRENLRGMLERSPLMDYGGYAREFGEMLQRWWAKRCTGEN
ncbi:MAG: tetratricopeptide repeat protein [Verrucomicrobiota bacterium]|nr:tetratricopeptide repeat protein [Verrucomicrobiota bacterium]